MKQILELIRDLNKYIFILKPVVKVLLQEVMCEKCGKVFVSKYHLGPHVRKHTSQEVI